MEHLGFRMREGVDLWVGMSHYGGGTPRAGGAPAGVRGTPVGIGAVVGASATKKPPVQVESTAPPPPCHPSGRQPLQAQLPRPSPPPQLPPKEHVVVDVQEDAGCSSAAPDTAPWFDYAFFMCCFLAFQIGSWAGDGRLMLPPDVGEGPACGGGCAPMWQHMLVPVLAFYMGWRHGSGDHALQVCGLVCSIGLSAFLASSGEQYVAAKACLLVVLVSASVYASGRLWVGHGVRRGGKLGIRAPVIPMGGMLIMLALLAVAIQDPSVVLSVWGLVALCTVAFF